MLRLLFTLSITLAGNSQLPSDNSNLAFNAACIFGTLRFLYQAHTNAGSCAMERPYPKFMQECGISGRAQFNELVKQQHDFQRKLAAVEELPAKTVQSQPAPRRGVSDAAMLMILETNIFHRFRMDLFAVQFSSMPTSDTRIKIGRSFFPRMAQTKQNTAAI